MLKHATYRIIFIFFMMLMLASFGLSLVVLTPIYTWYFHREFKFLKYSRLWYSAYRLFARHMLLIIRNREYRKRFKVRLTDAPHSSPDLRILRISESWKGDIHTCNGCISCCDQLGCIFLDREKKHCRAYKSFYWNYFNCGRYPTNQFQIDYYKCPKWKIKEEQLQDRHINNLNENGNGRLGMTFPKTVTSHVIKEHI